jgi:hypothetical protein
MTKPNFVEIVVVLDRSGSMETVRTDTIGGFNAFIEEQKKNKVGDVKVSLFQFDNVYETVYNGKPINEVPALTKDTFVPRGMTALLDAVGRAITDVGARLAQTPEEERPSLVIFVILTDGQENASKEFKIEKVKEMIKHQTESYSWQFVFLGADQDAFQAAQMGIGSSNTFNYVSKDTVSTYSKLSRGISVTCDMMMSRGVEVKNIGDLMRDEEKKK